MAQKTTKSPQVVETALVETARKPTYRSPEVADLGKASKLLQGGARVGGDGSSLTYSK